MSTREHRAISDRLRPEMIHALLRGWAEHGSTRTGLVARRLACPGTKANDLRFTPMGRQLAGMLEVMHDAHKALVDARGLLAEGATPTHVARAHAIVAASAESLRRQVWP